MTDQQIELSREDENIQDEQSNIEQQEQEYMKISKLIINQGQNNKVKKRKSKKKIKFQRKNLQLNKRRKLDPNLNVNKIIKRFLNKQKEFDNLIKQGMSVKDIHYLIDLLQKQQHETIIEELRVKYPTLLESYRRELLNSQIMQNSRQCFTTYLQQHGLPKGQMPPNCLHINICYYIWEKQGKSHIDPTLNGRERKSQQMQNKLSEDQQIQSKQFSQKFLKVKKKTNSFKKGNKKYKVLIFFFANQFFMDEFSKLEQLQEYEKFSFNKDGQLSDNKEHSNKQFKFDNNNLDVNKRYRFNSFENQNQLNEKDMTILQCLMQNDFPNHTEDFFLKKRRKSSCYDHDNNDNILEFSKQRKKSFPLLEDKEIQQISNDQLFNDKKESQNDQRIIKQSIISKQDQSIKNTIQPISTEKTKLNAKIIKVAAFWKSQTFFIPNVFRMVKPVVSSKEQVFEIQDLSMKEVLIQSNGQKIKEMQ